MYYPDKKYKSYLDTMQDLLKNKKKFVQAELEIASKLGKKKTAPDWGDR